MLEKPLAVYIHWPFCLSKCPYCDFNSHVREKIEQERWKNALLRELAYMHSHTPDFIVSSIFFGGGTPSLMPADTVEALISRVGELWKNGDDIEITLEANPTSVEADKFIAFREAGVNRVSLGVQSLRDNELKFLGRGHSAQEAIRAIELARKTFERYSFDLIYARPNQTLQDWDNELSEALQLAGGHLSLYQLTIEENTAFHHAYSKGGFILPDEELSEALYRLTEEKMCLHGLAPYEVSNYARIGQESRHNLSYWRGDSYIGVGAGAHGRINVDGRRVATQTLKSPERWLENVEKSGNAVEVWQEITPETFVEERVMMGLRLRDGINYRDFKEQTGYDLGEHINLSKRDFYMGQGLLADDKNAIKTTLKGRLLLNKLTAELLS
ncbi:MAG: radical SAM family heme chaperone HemW [Rickettsiales bacterium]